MNMPWQSLSNNPSPPKTSFVSTVVPSEQALVFLSEIVNYPSSIEMKLR